MAGALKGDLALNATSHCAKWWGSRATPREFPLTQTQLQLKSLDLPRAFWHIGTLPCWLVRRLCFFKSVSVQIGPLSPPGWIVSANRCPLCFSAQLKRFLGNEIVADERRVAVHASISTAAHSCQFTLHLRNEAAGVARLQRLKRDVVSFGEYEADPADLYDPLTHWSGFIRMATETQAGLSFPLWLRRELQINVEELF